MHIFLGMGIEIEVEKISPCAGETSTESDTRMDGKGVCRIAAMVLLLVIAAATLGLVGLLAVAWAGGMQDGIFRYCGLFCAALYGVV